MKVIVLFITQNLMGCIFRDLRQEHLPFCLSSLFILFFRVESLFLKQSLTVTVPACSGVECATRGIPWMVREHTYINKAIRSAKFLSCFGVRITHLSSFFFVSFFKAKLCKVHRLINALFSLFFFSPLKRQNYLLLSIAE